MNRKAKFQVGDTVEIIKCHEWDGNVQSEIPPVGTVGKVDAIEDDIMSDGVVYSLDCDTEFVYSENMLRAVNVPEEKADKAEHNGESGEVVYSRPAEYEKPKFFMGENMMHIDVGELDYKQQVHILVRYYVDQNRVIVRMKQTQEVVLDDNSRNADAYNHFITGFLEGLRLSGLEGVIQAEYIRG